LLNFQDKFAYLGKISRFNCGNLPMYPYQGQLIHQGFDAQGSIEVIDDHGERALYFGSPARQSTMSLHEPDKLLSLYARAMMSWLLFKPRSEYTLMIGLGGGLLAKYFLHNFADCRLQVIEYRRAMVKIAQDYFALPQNPRLQIRIDDGAVYTRRQSQQQPAQHDLILVDAFDADGMANSMIELAFFDSCQQLLTADGILMMNLWATNKPLFNHVAWNLQQVFAERLLFLPVRKRGNVIALAFNQTLFSLTFKELKLRSQILADQHQLEFPQFLNDLKKHNSHSFQKLILS
jgi:spermidine synthase